MRCKNAHLLKPFIFCTHSVHLISSVQSKDATLQLQYVNNSQKDRKVELIWFHYFLALFSISSFGCTVFLLEEGNSISFTLTIHLCGSVLSLSTSPHLCSVGCSESEPG